MFLFTKMAVLYLLLNFEFLYENRVSVHYKMYGYSMELETVYPSWVVLIVRAWVAGQDAFYGLPLTWGEVVFLTDRVGDADLQGVVVSFRSPTCRGFGVRVGKGQVRLDVQDGSAIH